MIDDIRPIDCRAHEARTLVSAAFDGYSIPDDPPNRSSIWMGHVLEGVVVSVAAIDIYQGDRWTGGLHTACVHPDFIGNGFQRELIEKRIQIAKMFGCDLVTAHAWSTISRKNLELEGFAAACADGVPSGFMALWINGERE